MVQHNDKWKKKASREYHKKHSDPSGHFRGADRGRGRSRGGFTSGEILVRENRLDVDKDEPRDSESSEHESHNEDETSLSEGERDMSSSSATKVSARPPYARRKLKSNAWRYEEEIDPYLAKQLAEEDSKAAALEPDYAHLPSRPLTYKTSKYEIMNPSSSLLDDTLAKERLKHTIDFRELKSLKTEINKANAERAFKERFSTPGMTGGVRKNTVLSINESGSVTEEKKQTREMEFVDYDDDDISQFLAEMNLKKDEKESEINTMGGKREIASTKNGAVFLKTDRKMAELDHFLGELL